MSKLDVDLGWIVFLFIMTIGEPDIIDMIIKYLQKAIELMK